MATHPPRVDTAEALLDAAEELFSARGYAAVGIREIVDRAGVNIAAIKYHFGSKSELYLQMVRRVMNRSRPESPWSLLDETPDDRESAADILVRYVDAYLRLLIDEQTPQSCGSLMLWEAVQPSEAIDAVVRDYIEPGQAQLVALVQRLLPDVEPGDAVLHARSILAQVLHHHVFRPFIERLQRDGDEPARSARETSEHVVRFSLRAMGHDDAFIDAAIARVAGEASHHHATEHLP